MDYSLTDEQKAVRGLCRDFAKEVVTPAAEELDREHKFGYDIVRQMGELGLFGLPFDEQYGGGGARPFSPCPATRGISPPPRPPRRTLPAAPSPRACPPPPSLTPRR